MEQVAIVPAVAIAMSAIAMALKTLHKSFKLLNLQEGTAKNFKRATVFGTGHCVRHRPLCPPQATVSATLSVVGYKEQRS